MNRALKWKLVGGFVLVFIAGGMTGTFVGATHARHLFLGWHQKTLAERMRHRLRVELRLTDDQLAKISPIIDKTAARLQDIRRSSGQQAREVMLESHREMAPNLTDEQRAKLQALESRSHHWHWFHRSRRSPPVKPEL
jgi:Spy/CpxP family protein refolding chaperone